MKYSYDVDNIKIFSDPYSKGWIKIGKFCSIGPDILGFSSGHNTAYLSTYPFFRHLEEFPNCKNNIVSKGDIVIGNDVWIGAAAILLHGITIGDGAIVAAGSLVCKDVPPYTIVGGNPCRTIRKRYSDQQIDALLKIKWWTWEHQKINEALPLIQNEDVQAFIDKYLPEVQ